jgi:hypothetical protein
MAIKDAAKKSEILLLFRNLLEFLRFLTVASAERKSACWILLPSVNG